MHIIGLIKDGHTETPWKYGEMNTISFASNTRMAVGGITGRQKLAALNGGKRAFKRSLFFVYLYIYNNTRGEPSALGSFLIPEFFRHTNSVTDKIAGAIWGAGSPCPSESPGTFERSCVKWYGVLICARDAESPEKCTAKPTQNERGEKL